MKVILTREPPRNDSLRRILELAIDVVEVPATSTQYFTTDDILAQCAIQPETVIVTSPRAVTAALAVMRTYSPRTCIAVGSTTARDLVAGGALEVVTAEEEGARGVASLSFSGPVVTVGARETRPELSEVLNERGLVFQHCAAYVTHDCTLDASAIAEIQSADALVVAAPSAWRVVAPYVSSSALVVARGATTYGAVTLDHGRVVVATDETETVAAILSTLPEAH